MQISKIHKLIDGLARQKRAIIYFAAFLSAATPLPSKAADGFGLWLQGSCGSCHGNRGQGGSSSVDFPQGPSLRTSQLDAEGMFEIIGCGIVGTKMYASLIGAYKDHACWGIVGKEPPPDVLAVETFSAEDIHKLVQFIQSQIQIEPAKE